MRRTWFGVFVLTFALAPMLSTWVLMLGIWRSLDAPPTPVATPNPSSSPGLLGPLEILAFADPWFAGTIAFWLIPWLMVLVLFAIAAAAAVNGDRQQQVSWWRRPAALIAFSFFLGQLFACPWYYGVYQLAARS